MAACPAINQERDNFFQLTLLLFRDGNQKLREFFKSQWPVVYQNKTGTPPPSLWTDIPNDATDMTYIETKPMKFAFPDQKVHFDSGDTNTWDFTLITKVLDNSTLNFVTPSTPESNAIKELKEIRNELIGHAPDAKIPTAVFNTEWPKACNALKTFRVTQDDIDQVKEDVTKPVDVLFPFLIESLKVENEILDAINKLEETIKAHHQETLSAIQHGNEDVKNILQRVETLSEPKKCYTGDLKITEAQIALLDDRFQYFKDDVIATELLDSLPCLSQEQKDKITFNKKNFTEETALKTLIDAIKTCDGGFEMFVRSLVNTGLDHVAVLLDPDCDEHVPSKDVAESRSSDVCIDGTAADISIPVRILGGLMRRQTHVEEQIATQFISSSSEDCKKLRKAFKEILPKGVHFVRTKQFGEKITSDDGSASNGRFKDSVVFVFRISKESAVVKLMRIHKDNTLLTKIKNILLKSSTTNINNMDLELLFQKKDYLNIKKRLSQDDTTDIEPTSTEDDTTDIESTTSTEVGQREPVEEVKDRPDKIKVRQVYLDGCYQKEIKLRDYQQELAAPALAGNNTVICAPTNSGKTFVAMELAKKHLEAHRNTASEGTMKAKVIFVVNKQNLLLQQRSRFEEYLSMYNISDLSGNNSDNISLKDLLTHCDVVVLTAQILVNALDDKSVKITDISLLIFDECHHTQKEEPYNRIMMNYIEMKSRGETKLPQVVGLTASLGVGQASTLPKAEEHVLQICANLDATSNISTVRENKTDLQHHVTGDVPDMNFKTVPNDESNAFEKEVNGTMQEIENYIKNGYDDTPPLFSRQHESYRQWVELLGQNASVNKNDQQCACSKQLRSYHEALLINNFTRIEDALDYLEECFDKQHNYTDICQWLGDAYQKTKAAIKKYTDQPCNPLLSALEQLIVDFHENEENSKGIVFCRTRAYAVAIKRWINESEKLKQILRPDVLLGSGGGQHGLTQSEQESVIKKFKDGDVNIVIATSVAEEGLDISDCKYVIRYDVKTNEISSVQARGRIRAKEGTYVYLSDNRSRGAEHELKNQSKEALMDEAVEEIQKMNSEDFTERIKDIQDTTLFEYKVKKEQEAAPRQTVDESEKLVCLCGQCSKFICNVSDLRTWKNNRVIINKDVYNRMDVVEYKEANAIKKKFYCKKCNHDWGVIFNSQWPCLKLTSFKLQLNDELPTLYKKWKDFPYSIIDVKSVEDLKAAQRSCNLHPK